MAFREITARVTENIVIAKDVYRMRLAGDWSDITRPGQFVNISLEGFFLRRPISVCEVSAEHDSLTLIYKVVGHGTAAMSRLKDGDTLDVLSGLGNGFDVSTSGEHPVLIGGGVGTPPMYGLAKELVRLGRSVDVILGFNSAEDAFYAEEFDALNERYEFGCEGGHAELKVYTATVDGSLGTKGFVTDVLKELKDYTYYYACGPIPMLKAVAGTAAGDGQVSLEERMGCGFGACVGCSVETKNGWKKVCKDGPVFTAKELLNV